MKIEIKAGETIIGAAKEAIVHAKLNNVEVEFTFNGVDGISVFPQSYEVDIARIYFLRHELLHQNL